jgi:hypothetical protein
VPLIEHLLSPSFMVGQSLILMFFVEPTSLHKEFSQLEPNQLTLALWVAS